MGVVDDDTEDARSIEGGTEARVKIKRWLDPILKGPDAEGDLHVLLLRDAKIADKEVDKFIYEVGTGHSLDDFIGNIVDAAEEEAAEYVKKVKFICKAKGIVGGCRFTLTVPIREGNEDDDDPDEGPTTRGLVHQSQRHTEVMARIMVDTVRSTFGTLKEQLREANERNNFLMRHQVEQIKVTESLRSMEFEREELREERRRKKERQERALEMAQKALPVVASKLLGGGTKMAQEMGASPVDDQLVSLFKSLEKKPELLQTIQQNLDPVDLANLFELHKYVAEKGSPTPQEGGSSEGRRSGGSEARSETKMKPETDAPRSRPQEPIEGTFDDDIPPIATPSL